MLSFNLKLLLVTLFWFGNQQIYQQNFVETRTSRIVASYGHSLVLDGGKVIVFTTEHLLGATTSNGNGLEYQHQLVDIHAIATGSSSTHILTLKTDGTVSGWGKNEYGQLGNQTKENTNTPQLIEGLNDILQVATGHGHSIALDRAGTVWTWGWNKAGQLGIGNVADQHEPIRIPSLNEVIDVKAGYAHSLALKADGTVWAWGKNNMGQLGNGNTTSSKSPTKVHRLKHIVAISAGSFHNIALDKNGKVWTWGWNEHGQLGDSSFDNWNMPIELSLEGVAMVAAGGLHSLALDKHGKVWAWGSNSTGQATGKVQYSQTVPKQIPNLNQVIEISAGDLHSLALKKDQTLWAWGMNSQGQLGIDYAEHFTRPTKVYTIESLEQPALVVKQSSLPNTGNFSSKSGNQFSEEKEINVYGLDTNKVGIVEQVAEKPNKYFEITSNNEPLVDTMFNLVQVEFTSNMEDCPVVERLNSMPILLKCQTNNVTLLWTVPTAEADEKQFAVERSTNGKDWVEIDAKFSIRQGKQLTYFEMQDLLYTSGKNYYRLKQVDCYENLAYSSVVTTDCFSEFSPKLQVVADPDSNAFKVTINNPAEKRLTYRMEDEEGNILALKTLKEKKAAFLEGTELKEGTYFMFLVDPKNRIIDTRKLEKTDN